MIREFDTSGVIWFSWLWQWNHKSNGQNRGAKLLLISIRFSFYQNFEIRAVCTRVTIILICSRLCAVVGISRRRRSECAFNNIVLQRWIIIIISYVYVYKVYGNRAPCSSWDNDVLLCLHSEDPFKNKCKKKNCIMHFTAIPFEKFSSYQIIRIVFATLLLIYGQRYSGCLAVRNNILLYPLITRNIVYYSNWIQK